jgi:hypothetical protein
MKMKMTGSALLLSLILALVASAQSPRPSPTPQRTPPDKATSPGKPTPASSATAASPATKASSTVQASDALPSPADQAAPPPGPPPPAVTPNPILYLISMEPYTTGGKNWIRYRYDVFNKSAYPADMFAPAPSLPPCGSNTNSSRTWLDFFDFTGKRLYGFCALTKPDDLGKIWFALEEGVIPPSYVYIELNDRQLNKKYKSNLADTTL